MLGTVDAKTGDAGRRAMAIHRQQILPIAWLLVLAAACLAGLMLFTAIMLDARTRVESIDAMRAGLNERKDQLDRVVKDYAWWNEAVEAIQIAHDRDWAAARLGPYLYGTHAYDWAFVIAPDNSMFFAGYKGEPHPQSMAEALANERWRPLVARARAAIQTIENDKLEPLAVNTFLPMHDGQLGIASATVILPETSGTSRRRWARPMCWSSCAAERRVAEELVRALRIDEDGAVQPLDRRAVDGAGVRRPRWQTGGPVGVAAEPSRHPVPPDPGAVPCCGARPVLAVRLVRPAAEPLDHLRNRRERDPVSRRGRRQLGLDLRDRRGWAPDLDLGALHRAHRDLAGRNRGPAASSSCCCRWPARTCRPSSTRPWREHRLFRSIPRCYLDLEGRPRALRVSGKPTSDDAGNHIGWRGTATDVTVEIEARKTAEFLSGHDALTGAPQPPGADRGHDQAARGRTAARTAGGVPLARPRPVQGSQRRPRPDRRRPAIRPWPRSSATWASRAMSSARLGADEFVLVRPAVGDAQAAQRLARRCRTSWRCRC